MTAPAPSPPPAAGPARFLRANAPWLAAGVAMTFASSFGQTFFVALFAGGIRAEFGLSHGLWGGIYTLGTLASAVAMLWAGTLSDRLPPRRLAAAVLALLAAVCLAMAAVPVWWLLPLLIFGLRVCGQGMLPHVAMVAVGRWFLASRGRAVSVVGAGHSLGEAVLPFPFVLLIGWAGWRAGWLAAAVLALAAIPVLAALLARDRTPAGTARGDGAPGLLGRRHWTRREMLGHWLIWACLPGLLAQPVFATALFFQQVHVAEVKGWPLEGFVALLPVFVAGTLAGLFATGSLVDRLGSGRVVPVLLLPMGAAFLVFGAADRLAGAALGFALLGLALGGSAVTAGAFWPEHYGTRHLGAIRATVSSAWVMATAVSPLATGVMIDAGIGIEAQFFGMGAYCLTMALVLALAMARARREAARRAPGAPRR